MPDRPAAWGFVLQEKTLVATALQKCKDRAAVNFTLAEKLNKLIGVYQHDSWLLVQRRLSVHQRQSFMSPPR